MSTMHEFWVHGIELHVQNEPAPIATREELDGGGYRYPNPRRNSQGTTIRQNTGDNWVYFALPSNPIYLDSEYEEHENQVQMILYRGRSNGKVSLQQLHVWSGGAPQAHRVYRAQAFMDGSFAEEFDVVIGSGAVAFEWRDPLVICFLLHFESGGEITFGGAGVRFLLEEVGDGWV
jgi:hypothetical protein